VNQREQGNSYELLLTDSAPYKFIFSEGGVSQ